MKPRRWCCALALFLGFGGAAAHAQRDVDVRVVRHGDDRLVGITEVDVLVRVTPARVAPCAVARAPLQELAMATLRAIPIKVTLSEKASSWFYTVMVTVTSRPAADSCASAVVTELVAQVQAMPEADRLAPAGSWGSLLVGELPLAHETALVTTPAKAHDAAVEKIVQGQISSLGRRIRAANP